MCVVQSSSLVQQRTSCQLACTHARDVAKHVHAYMCYTCPHALTWAAVAVEVEALVVGAPVGEAEPMTLTRMLEMFTEP